MTSRSRTVAQAAFALTMVGLGVFGLITGSFAPIWTGVPRSLPARGALAYLCALVSFLCGVGLLRRRTAAGAAAALLMYLLLWLVGVNLVGIVRAPGETGPWWSAGQTAVMAGAAWALWVWCAADRRGPLPNRARSNRAARFAGALYGLGLVPFGIAHFTYFDRTVSMVPAWLPWHQAWACLTGGAFVAAGAAVVAGVCARLAATLVAWQIGLFTVLVWGPVVAAGSPTPFEWHEIVVSWVLTTAAGVVATSYRGSPWLGVARTEGVDDAGGP